MRLTALLCEAPSPSILYSRQVMTTVDDTSGEGASEACGRDCYATACTTKGRASSLANKRSRVTLIASGF